AIDTSGRPGSNNLGVIARLAAAPPGRHRLVGLADHRSILDPANRLERRGAELAIIPVDGDGQVDPRSVESAIRPNTVLASIMLANNEVGTINSIAEIAGLCHSRGVLLHCD